MKMDNYIFKDLKTKKDKKQLIDFLRYQTTAEYGGHQIFDGRRSHLLHIPEELADFIFFLKLEKNLLIIAAPTPKTKAKIIEIIP